MILPEDILDNMKYYTYTRFEPQWDLDFSSKTCYDEIVIHFKQWWKRRLTIQLPCRKIGFKTYVSSEECVELLNQIKTHIAADNGYKVDEPKIKLNIQK